MLEARGRDAELGRDRPRHHARHRQRSEIVARDERLARQHLEHARLQPRERVRQPDDPRGAADQPPGIADDLLEPVGARPAELVGPAARRVAHAGVRDRLRDVADVDRLHQRVGHRERQHRKDPLKPRERVDKRVARAEHDRRPEYRDVQRARRGLRAQRDLAVALRAQVHARRVRIGAERAHVKHARHARFDACGGERRGQRDVQPLEALAVRLAVPAAQHADEIDGRLRARDETGELAHVEGGQLDDVDGQRREMPRMLAPARADTHVRAGADEHIDEAATDEARAAEHRDGLALHDRAPSGAPPTRRAGGECDTKRRPAAPGQRVRGTPLRCAARVTAR
ncbi:200 kDa antigen p200, putative [Burkholderia pseudomallei 1710b]|uniref:200 kDa antigen p200, putative n=1 Tax=Burkholderia pseudomallei (strain 1710b) TaxID=320372 RepID=Q3JX35_BURP1|nr:200 kDa antigen p200, putative [Burkholderia pseudomallei 1710b]